MARDRANDRFAEHDFLYRAMLDGLIERIGDVSRPLQDVLVIGCPDRSARDQLAAMGKRVICCDPGAKNAALNAGFQTEEDELPFPENSFDLVLACGTLDSVNDLPGALINARRVLRPDGLFLAACTGAGTLPRLKSALLEAEGDRAAAHIHPQIDIRAAGDLLARAGFSMPVADLEMLTVRYSSIIRLMHDLRHMGACNVMARERSGPLTKDSIARATAYFTTQAAADGKVSEQFALLFLSGWKPDPSQPQPARRGSAKMSLADALKPRT